MKIYLFGYKDIYKIGVSYDPKKRVQAFKFMSIICEIDTNNAYELEEEVMEKFKHLNIGGEFFEDKNNQIYKYLQDVKVERHDVKVIDVFVGDFPAIADDNYFINLTEFRKVTSDYERGTQYHHLNLYNILKLKVLSDFIADFENQFGFSPIKTCYGKTGGTYVHPFLLLEYSRMIGNAKIKVACYSYAFNPLVIEVGIKKAINEPLQVVK
jgi:hypothetical protein